MKTYGRLVLYALILFLVACHQKKSINYEMMNKVNSFAEVELKSDLSHLSDNEKKMLPLLFEAAKIMDEIFWDQAFGDPAGLFDKTDDELVKAFIKINYGPWERLNSNKPFVDGYMSKPPGANFYPADITRAEFDAFVSDDKTSQYSLIRRDENGNLIAVPYRIAYKVQHEKVAELLREAAKLADYENLKNYLNLRAEALLTDNYQPSDMAWMDMKDNNIDFVVGPIENYEDGLYNYKAAHEAYILIKDREWSDKLSRFAGLLPALQKSLPVGKEYKTEIPGSDSDLGVYDAIYYAGDCNSGSKTIAINLPNDPEVHLKKGSRKLQLKNSMRYKFDKILQPIGNVLIDPSQQKHITFNAFFENTMFHEVAHGLGIKNTINNSGTVREALLETYTPIEENKADILGLYMVTKLVEMGELSQKDLMDNYVTFMAGIFRSVRFGAASSHGKSNMISFYFFQENEAFTRDNKTGTYKVNFDKMEQAISSLAKIIITMQGNGDYNGAIELLKSKGKIMEELQADLNRVNSSGIPVDIRFIQGPEILGLK